MITVNELQDFLEDDERQILALDQANLLKINAIDEETGVNIPGISYICCVDWPVGVTPFSKHSTTGGTNLLGIYDNKNKKLYHNRIPTFTLDDDLKKIVDEIRGIKFKKLCRLVEKEVDKILQKEYQSLRVQKQIENYDYTDRDFKEDFIDQRIKNFFEENVTVYGETKGYELKLTAYDYAKLISNKEYVRNLALRYLSSKGWSKSNLEVNIETYIYKQAKLNYNRNISLNDDDKQLLELLMSVSKAKNARTVKLTYKQGEKLTEVTVNVAEIIRSHDSSNGYSFSNYAITIGKEARKFSKSFTDEENNPFGNILIKNIKRVTYGKKVLFERR